MKLVNKIAGDIMNSIDIQPFGLGSLSYRLQNSKGMQVVLTDFGARIVQILLPVEEDKGLRNVCLSRHSAEEYQETPYIGATVAPAAGRLFQGDITLYDRVLELTENGPGFSLHSGPKSASMQLWQSECDAKNNSVTFTLTLADNYNGFPGPIQLSASYCLREDNSLYVSYKGRSSQATLFNPTNHVFFNLTGNFMEPIHDHGLQIKADRVQYYTEQGRFDGIHQVSQTPYDYRYEKSFGEGLGQYHPQLELLGGFDNCWLLTCPEKAATVTSPDGKIKLHLSTNQDGVVIYTYNNNNPKLAVKQGAFSLECLASIEESHLLEPEKTVESWTCYRFEY